MQLCAIAGHCALMRCTGALTLTLPKRRTAHRERGLTELPGQITPT
ncbi:hypothetical protein PS925_03280 [Pseudomonas fluorescens]|uniref:Uncharacterized protein n=1 Tax=Pseudomonas fluorescens TaxID=294 RepID=A0A5E7UQ13_PSEFL|nr:hypothetical protein PS925_03280 [Pseudomonas fluorescens]